MHRCSACKTKFKQLSWTSNHEKPIMALGQEWVIRMVFSYVTNGEPRTRQRFLSLNPFSFAFGLKAICCRSDKHSIIQSWLERSKNYLLRLKRRKNEHSGSCITKVEALNRAYQRSTLSVVVGRVRVRC